MAMCAHFSDALQQVWESLANAKLQAPSPLNKQLLMHGTAVAARTALGPVPSSCVEVIDQFEALMAMIGAATGATERVTVTTAKALLKQHGEPGKRLANRLDKASTLRNQHARVAVAQLERDLKAFFGADKTTGGAEAGPNSEAEQAASKAEKGKVQAMAPRRGRALRRREADESTQAPVTDAGNSSSGDSSGGDDSSGLGVHDRTGASGRMDLVPSESKDPQLGVRGTNDEASCDEVSREGEDYIAKTSLMAKRTPANMQVAVRTQPQESVCQGWRKTSSGCLASICGSCSRTQSSRVRRLAESRPQLSFVML